MVGIFAELLIELIASLDIKGPLFLLLLLATRVIFHQRHLRSHLLGVKDIVGGLTLGAVGTLHSRGRVELLVLTWLVGDVAIGLLQAVR